MSNPTTEFDTPWKDALERYFSKFIAFFFPQAYGEITNVCLSLPHLRQL